ncbi:MAG: cyclic nucleotide-binding domain-containing protein [Deltaproteobacteria bacterium]|nr:cyclic nucleotide-binding domain-containing protein [Deltaproteobacteria bacterium]
MEDHEILTVLKRTDPFEILEADVLKQLSKKTGIKAYFPNSYVFRQGDQSLDRLFIIASGLVEITVTNDRGLESVVGLRRAYDFLGETVILSQQRYPASARAKEDLVCLVITRKQFEKLIYDHPEFSSFFNALLAERMRLLYEEIVAQKSYEAYSSAESPLFGKRVSEIMSFPVVTCSMSDSVSAVSKIMSEKDISAVIALDSEQKPRGIITESSLVKHLIAQQLYPISTCRVEQIVNSHLVTVGPESFIGQALVSMIRNKTRYLIVMERGRLVGIIAMVDLIKLRSTGQMLLTQNIESQQSIQGLSVISREVDHILGDMVAEKAALEEILDVMSELHERLTQRVMELSDERMKREGWGSAPVDYCWINLGSAARYEQTLRTDQDNAILYADPEPEMRRAVDAYFKKFAEIVVEGLEACGFARCPENISPVHTPWRRSQSEWLLWVKKWSKTFLPRDTRMMAILLDLRPVWGNKSLSRDFVDSLFSVFRQSLQVRRKPVADDTPPPISAGVPAGGSAGFPGTIVTEKSGIHKDEINLKSAGIQHLVSGIRILAAGCGIQEPSTLGRLEQLAAAGAISPEELSLYRTSFESLMLLALDENLKKIGQGRLPDNYLDPYALRKRERILLKDALSGAAHLQKIINQKASGIWLTNMT